MHRILNGKWINENGHFGTSDIAMYFKVLSVRLNILELMVEVKFSFLSIYKFSKQLKYIHLKLDVYLIFSAKCYRYYRCLHKHRFDLITSGNKQYYLYISEHLCISCINCLYYRFFFFFFSTTFWLSIQLVNLCEWRLWQSLEHLLWI